MTPKESYVKDWQYVCKDCFYKMEDAENDDKQLEREVKMMMDAKEPPKGMTCVDCGKEITSIMGNCWCNEKEVVGTLQDVKYTSKIVPKFEPQVNIPILNAEQIEDMKKKLEEIVRGEEANNPIVPNHYHKGGIDLLTFIDKKLSKERKAGFYQINILKYLTRYQDKNGVEDLKKAQYYLNKLIELESS